MNISLTLPTCRAIIYSERLGGRLPLELRGGGVMEMFKDLIDILGNLGSFGCLILTALAMLDKIRNK